MCAYFKQQKKINNNNNNGIYIALIHRCSKRFKISSTPVDYLSFQIYPEKFSVSEVHIKLHNN